MSDGGKGSRPRPFSIDSKTFQENLDRIFKKDLPSEPGHGDQRINNQGQLEEFREGYWLEIRNPS